MNVRNSVPLHNIGLCVVWLKSVTRVDESAARRIIRAQRMAELPEEVRVMSWIPPQEPNEPLSEYRSEVQRFVDPQRLLRLIEEAQPQPTAVMRRINREVRHLLGKNL